MTEPHRPLPADPEQPVPVPPDRRDGPGEDPAGQDASRAGDPMAKTDRTDGTTEPPD